MGYPFTVKNGVYVKEEREYPWPHKEEPERMIKLFTDDVLTKREDGTYMKHNGYCITSLILTDDEVEPIGHDVDLAIL